MSTLEVNPNKEYILAGDISNSMTMADPLCGNSSRYKYMLEKFKQFIKTAEEYDPHGPTILLFGENVHVYPDSTLEKVNSALDSVAFEGFTNLDLAIKSAYAIHLEKKREMEEAGETHPGTVMLVFTDGEPTARLPVLNILVKIANEIKSEDEFNVVLLTVGTIDRGLQQYLDNLHDDLEAKNPRDFDIFHVMRLEQTSFLNSVMGSFVHGVSAS